MIRRRVRGTLPLALAVFALSSACGDPGETTAPRPPNFLLVSLDTLRADHVGITRNGRPVTPVLDALAREAVVFSQCISSAPVTLPAHASILTSLHPSHHGASNKRRTRIAESVTTLAELLAAEGYSTASFNGGIQLDAAWGIDRGFEVYESVREWTAPPRTLSGPENRMSAIVARGIAWLRHSPEEPFFLFLHSYEIHHPYTPDPESLRRVERPYAGDLGDEIPASLLNRINAGDVVVDAADRQHIADTYVAELHSADRALQPLFDFLREQGLYDDMLIVFTSDHGEEFGEHGKLGMHSHTLYDELLRVPLLVKFPHGDPGRRVIDGQVRAIDIAPTALATLGLPVPAQFEGVDLGPAARAGFVEGLAALSQMDGRAGAQASFRRGRWKVAGDKLFDLAADPGEQIDLAAKRPKIAGELRRELARQLAARPQPSHVEQMELTDETRERMKALGYID